MAMSYGDVYVGKVAIGADDAHTVKVFREAEAYDGVSLIIAYCHCIAHGIEMVKGLEQQKKAVDSGHWMLMRYNPDLLKIGKNPLTIDSKAPSLPLEKYIYGETRYKSLKITDPDVSKELMEEHELTIERQRELYTNISEMKTLSE